jgi:hypothetical protein
MPDFRIKFEADAYREALRQAITYVDDLICERGLLRLHSVDRTRSSKRRAGGRRNKKLHNVRTFKSDWKGPRQ